MSELKELPEPIGNFILENITGVDTPTGVYYHYADVCTLLKKYKKTLLNKKNGNI